MDGGDCWTSDAVVSGGGGGDEKGAENWTLLEVDADEDEVVGAFCMWPEPIICSGESR